MAKIIVNKYHLITMGLYSKQLNGEHVSFTEDEFINFANAYINDSRRPTTDYMDNIYSYDFSNISLTNEDTIAYNPISKTYTAKCKILDLVNRYMQYDSNHNIITPQISQYLELLGKERLYKNQNNQPTN